jgi:hypothetical protein
VADTKARNPKVRNLVYAGFRLFAHQPEPGVGQAAEYTVRSREWLEDVRALPFYDRADVLQAVSTQMQAAEEQGELTVPDHCILDTLRAFVPVIAFLCGFICAAALFLWLGRAGRF